MIDRSLAYSFSTVDDLQHNINQLLSHPEEIAEKNRLSKQFVDEHTGATKKILDLIEQEHLLK